MRESDALIREELRIQDLSKRIQEQNEYEVIRPQSKQLLIAEQPTS
jgi:hypothetical protein